MSGLRQLGSGLLENLILANFIFIFILYIKKLIQFSIMQDNDLSENR